jgi:hypothetical protein
MTTRRLTLSQQTRLAVNVLIEDETGILSFSILLVTGMFSVLWQANRFFWSIRTELSLLMADAKAALDFTGKVLLIGLSSLAYGLGVRL